MRDTLDPRIIGTYEDGDATGRAVVRDALGTRNVQLKAGVRKRRGQPVTIDEVQRPPTPRSASTG